MKSRFLQVYLLQAFYCLPIALGWSFALLFYFALKFTPTQIAVYYVLYYLTMLSALLLFRKHKTFSLIKVSFVFMFIGFFLMSNLSNETMFYLIAVVFGLTSAFFWVAYNITYFSFKGESNTALLSGFMFLIASLLNTIVPLFSGIVVDAFGFRMLFLMSMALALVALAYASGLKDSSMSDLELHKTLKPAKGVRTLVCLEGFWQGITWISIPLITFSFMKSGLEYGSFLSYLGLVGALAVLLLCRISDLHKNRMAFIVPITILLSLASIASGLTDSFGGWIAVNGLISFFAALTSPFTISVILDKIKDVRDAMVSRELFLNIGRISGVFVLIISLSLFNSLKYSLIIAGLAFMLYPVVLKLKKLYPHKISLKSILSEETHEYR
ncbi:MAG: hypothetical protein FJY77_04855 [Candidatus Altiarchaeales archaeon]|nr:hypothetical protein [Candidatus Altiarchaeales archaeon]